MMGSMVKAQFEQFLGEYAKPGYEFEFNSGGAFLRNVELKPDGILPTSLPVYVVSGFIKQVEISLPFTTLNSQAVEVKVEDVLLIVKPKNTSVWTEQDELKAFSEERKRAAACEWGEDALQLRLEEFMKLYFEQDGNSSGYKSQLSKIFQRVVNNLSIEIKNFHVRYEEHLCETKDKCHAMGWSVDRLVSYATNAEWQKEFATQSHGSLRRLVELENVHVYCDANSKSVIRPEELKQRECLIGGQEIMRRVLDIEDQSNASASKTLQWWDSTSEVAHHYLISPLSAVSFQIVTHVLDPSDVIGRRAPGSLSCHMQSDPVALLLDTNQISILLHFLNGVNLYTRWQHAVRRTQHFKMVAEIPDGQSVEFQALVRKKMREPLFMTAEENRRLDELQSFFPLYRLSDLRKRGLADASIVSPTSSSDPVPNDDDDGRKLDSGSAESKPREVEVVFQEGSLGMDIELNPQKFGHRAVRVNGCVPGSQAANTGLVQPGFVFAKIGDVSTDDLGYDEVLNLLRASARPLRVVFRTAPKESTLTHHDLDKDTPPQKLTFTAVIESYSFSFVAANVRREVLRILGSGLRVYALAHLSPMGVATSVHGTLSTKTVQFSDRWNPSASFDSQCIVQIVGHSARHDDPAIDISFDIPLVPQRNAAAVRADRKSGQSGTYQTKPGGYARLASKQGTPCSSDAGTEKDFSDANVFTYPNAVFTVGSVDLCVIVEHWQKLLSCLDAQYQLIEEGRRAIRALACSEFHSTMPPGSSSGNESDVELGVELIPNPTATVLSGMITGPQTLTDVTFASFQSTFYAKFVSLRFLRHDTCPKTAYEAALAIRAARVHCVTSENGAFLNLIEASLCAFTMWSVGQTTKDATPHFVAGYVGEAHTVCATYELERDWIKQLAAGDAHALFSPQHGKTASDTTICEAQGNVMTQLAVVAYLSQDEKERLHNQVSLTAEAHNTEIRLAECICAMSSFLDMLTPISRFASLLPIKPQARRFYFTDITALSSAICIVLTDRPSAVPNQLFGYQLNGQVRYSCSDDDEECAMVDAGPIWVGLHKATAAAAQPTAVEQNLGKVQLVYNRYRENDSPFGIKFTITESKCEDDDELGAIPLSNVYDSIGHWIPLPPSTVGFLLEQIQTELHLRWPVTQPHRTPLPLHEHLYSKFMENPNALIDRTAWSLVSHSVQASSMPSSIASYTAIHSDTMFDNFELSSVVYRSEAQGSMYLPSIVKTTDMLETVCKRKSIVACSLFENPCHDIYWKSRDLEVLSRCCVELSSLRLAKAQLSTAAVTLSSMECLAEIALSKCVISNESMEQLIASAPKLKSLELTEVSSLTSFEIDSKTLQRLTFRECVNIRDHVISQVLSDSPNLRYLSLEGCRHLHRVMFQSASLRELDLSGCTALDDCCISSACASCPELDTLDCTWCYQLVDPQLFGRSLTKVSLYRCTGLLDSVVTRLFAESPLLVSADLSGFKRHNERKQLEYPTDRVDLWHRWFVSKKTKKTKNSSSNNNNNSVDQPRFSISSHSLCELSLEDCTALTDQDVTMLTSRCPRLQSLNVNFCTGLENPVIASDALTAITARYAENLSTHAVEVMLTNCPKLATVNLQGCEGVYMDHVHPRPSHVINAIGCAPDVIPRPEQQLEIKIDSITL